MVESKIIVMDGGVRVVEMEIPRRDVATFLRDMPEQEREQTFIRAVEVGVFCLERAKTSADTEFVKRQVDSMLTEVHAAASAIPGKIGEALLIRIGTGEGQVLEPVKEQIDQAVRECKERIAEVRRLVDEANPDQESSVMNKAIRVIRDLLDPKRTDSVQGSIQSAVSHVSARDGVLAKAVKEVVSEAIAPLKAEVDELAKEIRGQETAAEALQRTAEKGATYEDEVVAELQSWVRPVGAEVHHVGGDNRPGDILVNFPLSPEAGTETRVVIETRDRGVAAGRKVVTEHLALAMAERESNAAVYLSRSRDGLAKEIGQWAEGRSEQGPWIACTNEHLTTAIRWLVVLRKLDYLRASAPEVDAASIEAQVRRIRTALGRVAAINRKLTTIRETTNEIQEEAEAMRDEVRAAVTEVENALRPVGDEPRKEAAA